jgi:hypothetical protein
MKFNHKKIIIGLLIAIAIAVIIMFIVQGEKNKANAPKVDGEPAKKAKDPTTPLPVIVYENGFPIVFMKFNENAKKIQTAIGLTGEDVDGKIGKTTLDYWGKLNPNIKSLGERFVISSQKMLDEHLAWIGKQQLAKVNFNYPDYGGIQSYLGSFK